MEMFRSIFGDKYSHTHKPVGDRNHYTHAISRGKLKCGFFLVRNRSNKFFHEIRVSLTVFCFVFFPTRQILYLKTGKGLLHLTNVVFIHSLFLENEVYTTTNLRDKCLPQSFTSGWGLLL